MAVTTTKTNKPLNPRGNDQSPKGYNRAELYTGKALDFDGVNDSIDLAGFTMSGTNASFVFNLKADVWGALDYIFDLMPKRLVFGTNIGNDISIYDSAEWHKFADFSDTTNTNNFALTIEGTTAKLYLNGQSFGNTVTLSTTIDLSATTEFGLMSRRNFTSNFFNGQLSGFKIFNTALTAAQVADLYNNPEKIVPTGVADSALKLWLPMMEGAGTTAYDGSGNGNHGTISGATYVNGVGSPVAQTAVMDWNKGQNIFTYSEDFTQWGNARTTDTANATTAPDGSDNAIKLEQQSGQTNAGSIYLSVTLTGGNDYQMSVFAKAGEKDFVVLYDSNANRTFFNVSTGVVGTNNSGGTATIEAFANDWYKCTITYTEPSTGNANVGYYLADTDNSTTVTDSGGIYLWGPSIALEGKNNSYLPTYGTIQNSDVLLPAGLTTGRDITGVNLFENVRKQGALNLLLTDYASVHDNSSIDLSTDLTLEAWVYFDGSSVSGGIIAKYHYSTSERSYDIRRNTSGNVQFTISDNGINTISLNYSGSKISTGWHHVLATYDQSQQKLYIDGVLNVYQNATISLYQTNKPVVIGKLDPTQSANSFEGQIAQPRIYNRALTAEEIERNYSAGKNTYK